MIISVSRRCDIPRFSFSWFMERLDVGFVEVKNPFNPDQIKQVSLLPPSPERDSHESAELFAFWTRDPSSILENAPELTRRGYRFFVMTTLTAYPSVLEPNTPPAESVIKTMRELSGIITPDKVIWRYDPVFLSNLSDYDYHRQNFAALASMLRGAVKRVIISVYDEYSRPEKRMDALEKAPVTVSGGFTRLPHYNNEGGRGGVKALLPSVKELLSDLARIAGSEGLEIQSCAETDLEDCGIISGACIDGTYIEKTFGLKSPAKDPNQRRPCRCAQSVDIGSYNACPAGCIYCYARR